MKLKPKPWFPSPSLCVPVAPRAVVPSPPALCVVAVPGALEDAPPGEGPVVRAPSWAGAPAAAPG